jgi:cytochrome P450
MGQVRTPVPPPLDTSVVRALVREMRDEVRSRRRAPYPAGSHLPSYRHTRDMVADPLPMLLDHERRFGPVFTIRGFHLPMVWAIGAEANHQILVTDFDAFEWRTGRFSDLWPLLGDGMLNIDGSYHREMRRLLLPAFHRDSVIGVADQMLQEADRAIGALKPGVPFDLYHWTRELALRIAMRALLGMRAGTGREGALADAFERALWFHAEPVSRQILRGPGSPYARTQKARRELDQLIRDEIASRRRDGDAGRGALGMLLTATDADGRPLPDGAIRDQAVTLLFAGHDTTTATLTFLLHELAGAPQARDALEQELDDAGDPTPEMLDGTKLPVLERTISETLRRYPPAWIGPRRSTRDVAIAGVPIPANAFVFYSSWATHHLPRLYPDPFRFEPDRFLPERVAALPKGAYVPFGGGSRMCLGKRFGEVELRALTTTLLRRFRVDPVPGAPPIRVATSPTLGPKGGLEVTVTARG